MRAGESNQTGDQAVERLCELLGSRYPCVLFNAEEMADSAQFSQIVGTPKFTGSFVLWIRIAYGWTSMDIEAPSPIGVVLLEDEPFVASGEEAVIQEALSRVAYFADNGLSAVRIWPWLRCLSPINIEPSSAHLPELAEHRTWRPWSRAE